jgi:hypothetical protein
VHKDVEVMPQDRGCLEQRVIRRQATIGPDLENELVVIGALTDTGVFNRVLDSRYGRKNGIDRDKTDRLIRALVFLGCGKAAADAHIELGIKFMFPIEGADQLLRV